MTAPIIVRITPQPGGGFKVSQVQGSGIALEHAYTIEGARFIARLHEESAARRGIQVKIVEEPF